MKLENILPEIHFLLTPDREHGKVFEKIPIIGFRRAKRLKDILARAKEGPLEKKTGCCRLCGGTRCKKCKHVVTTKTFRSFSTKRKYCIKPDNLNCRSSNVVNAKHVKNHAKHVQNNTQVVLKVFDLDSAITSQPIEISLKGILSNKRHFHIHFEDDKHHGMSD